MTLPFCTIGHSTRSLDAFARLLQAADVTLVVDIRTVPRSRANPQYNEDTLPDALSPFHVAYERIAALGGLRGASRTVLPEVNAMWQNRSFHNYADYALSDPFREGLDRLISLGRERRSAVMCSEAVWWRCHRRIVADYLLARGETTLHLMGNDRIVPARLTQGAVVQPSGAVLYPAARTEGVTD